MFSGVAIVKKQKAKTNQFRFVAHSAALPTHHTTGRLRMERNSTARHSGIRRLSQNGSDSGSQSSKVTCHNSAAVSEQQKRQRQQRQRRRCAFRFAFESQ